MNLYYAVARRKLYEAFPDSVIHVTGIFVVVCFLSFLLHVCIEVPFLNLDSLFFSPPISKETLRITSFLNIGHTIKISSFVGKVPTEKRTENADVKSADGFPNGNIDTKHNTSIKHRLDNSEKKLHFS